MFSMQFRISTNGYLRTHRSDKAWWTFCYVESTPHIVVISIANAARGDHVSSFPRISSARNTY